MQQEDIQTETKKRFYKTWWFLLIIVIIFAAALFIPYVHVIVECLPCPENVVCAPCPDYYQSLAGYLIDLL